MYWHKQGISWGEEEKGKIELTNNPWKEDGHHAEKNVGLVGQLRVDGEKDGYGYAITKHACSSRSYDGLHGGLHVGHDNSSSVAWVCGGEW